VAQTLYLMSFLNENKVRASAAINFQEDLHLTVVSNFTVPDKRMVDFQSALIRLAPWFFPLKLDVVNHVTLGTICQVPAAVVRAQSKEMSLVQMHDSFWDLIKQYGGKVNDPYSGTQYTPHITYLNSYTPVVLKSLMLVEHSEGFGKGIRTVKLI
jgi:hypothetical protein